MRNKEIGRQKEKKEMKDEKESNITAPSQPMRAEQTKRHSGRWLGGQTVSGHPLCLCLPELPQVRIQFHVLPWIFPTCKPGITVQNLLDGNLPH